MFLGKILLFLKLERKFRVNEATDSEEHYATAPLCKHPKGACICKRQVDNGPVKCFYKKGPQKCCFEKEQPKEVLEKSKA